MTKNRGHRGPDEIGQVAEVINLPEVIPPVRALLGFYDELLADSHPPIEQLDYAVRRIKALPTIPGRLGRDISLMARGGRGADRTEIVGALERLRHIAGWTNDHAASA